MTSRSPGLWSFPLAAAVNGIGTGLYIPFSLVFFHHVTGLSFPVVGAVLTTTGLAALTALPLAGIAVDRFGARPVLYALYGVRVVGFSLYPFAHSLPAFVAVALLTVAADRAFPAANQSLLGEVAEGADRDRLQSAGRALQNAGFGAGSLLATLVIAFAGPTAYTWTAWANAASFAVAALCLRPLRPVRRDTATPASASPTPLVPAQGGPTYRQVLADRPFLTITSANFLNALSYSSLSVLFPLFLVEQLHGPAALAGAAFTVNTVLCAVAGVAVGARVLRTGARRTRAAMLGGALFAMAFAAQALMAVLHPTSSTLIGAGLIVVVVVYTVGELIHSPAAEVLAVAAAPARARGRYMATYQMSWSLAKSLAPSLFTALLALDGKAPWLFLVVTSALAGALLLRAERSLPAEAVRPTPVREPSTAVPALV